jgi:hypothetical protein
MHLQRLLQQATDNSSEAMGTPTGSTPMLKKLSDGNQTLHVRTKQRALEVLLCPETEHHDISRMTCPQHVYRFIYVSLSLKQV